MSQARHVILNTVDTPLRILLWTVPELLMLSVPFFVGLLLEQLMLGMGVSLFYFWIYKKYQRHFGRGQFQGLKYWFLPTSRRFKSLPPSFIREYVG